MYIEEDIRSLVDGFINRETEDMGHALGIRFERISRDKMIATMPVDENTIQPFGLLHGGASVALAETLASVGAWINLKDSSKMAVGLEINANHIRPVKKGGMVRGIAEPLHRGTQTQVWTIRIENENGKLVSISRCTLAVVNNR